MPVNDRWKAPLMLVLATVFWGASFPTMKALALNHQMLVPESNSWFVAALCITYRFALAALIMLAWSRRTLRNLTRLEMWEGVGLGVFSSAGLLFQMDGLAYTAASTSAFLTQCYCLFIPIWVATVERRRISGRVILACVVVVLGVARLSNLDWRSLHLGRGELETTLGSVFFAGQILWLQRPRFARNDVGHFSAVMFVVMSLCMLPLVLASRPVSGGSLRAYAAPSMLVFLGILVVICTLGGYLLMNHWQPRVQATEAGLIYCAEPVFASLMSLYLPGWFSRFAGIHYADEQVTSSLLVGGGLITLANLLVQTKSPSAAPTA